MKKHFMFIAAIMLGLLISVGSCKNSKSSSDDDDTEKVEKKKKKSKKSKKHQKADRDDYDDDDWDDDEYDGTDVDFDDVDMGGMSISDVNKLTTSQANELLKYAVDHSDEIFGATGMDMTMWLRGSDLVMHAGMDFGSLGLTADQFQEAMQEPSVRDQMLSSMMASAGEDGKKFFALIAKAGKSLLLEFEDSDTGDVASCGISKTELKGLSR